MTRALAAFLLAASAAVPAAAQYAGGQAPAAPNIIDMSVVEALVAIQRPELAGIFTYVPESQLSVAMADFLLRDGPSLKRFIKKGEKDLKQTKAVNQWDKEVYLHLVAAGSGGMSIPGVEPLKKNLVDRVSRLSLSQGIPLQLLVQQRGAARR